MDGQMNARIDEQMDSEWLDGWWMDGWWVDGWWMDNWMMVDGWCWIGGLIDGLIFEVGLVEETVL